MVEDKIAVADHVWVPDAPVDRRQPSGTVTVEGISDGVSADETCDVGSDTGSPVSARISSPILLDQIQASTSRTSGTGAPPSVERKSRVG
jgi:hypothetical protein